MKKEDNKLAAESSKKMKEAFEEFKKTDIGEMEKIIGKLSDHTIAIMLLSFSQGWNKGMEFAGNSIFDKMNAGIEEIKAKQEAEEKAKQL